MHDFNETCLLLLKKGKGGKKKKQLLNYYYNYFTKKLITTYSLFMTMLRNSVNKIKSSFSEIITEDK